MTRVLRVTPYDDPVVTGLVEQVQAEYVVRYGGPDEAPVDPAEFVPPKGLFVVAWEDGRPAACGGWRDVGDADGLGRGSRVEIKRMFVVPGARGRGLARAVLAELERTAAAAGHERAVLETGTEQPEAMALYVSSGYEPIDGFGHYAGRPLARAFSKRLTR